MNKRKLPKLLSEDVRVLESYTAGQ